MSRIRRPEPSRETKKPILIAVEDEKSARYYFEKFRDTLRKSRVVVIADHVGSSPKSVIEAAKIAIAERLKLASLGEDDVFDETWIVFDTEGPQNASRHKAAKNAIDQAQQLGFKLAVSNPCFEYWFILHFEYYVNQLADGTAARKRLEKHLKNPYRKGDCLFEQTFPLIRTAISNSEKVWRERHVDIKHPCHCHPSTQVHELAKTLMEE